MKADIETRSEEAGPRTCEIVAEMLEYVVRGAVAFEAEHGPEASVVMQEMIAALMGQLEGNLGHVVLWEQFLQTPDEVSDALVGVFDGLRCRDLAFEEWLTDAWARYQAYAASTKKECEESEG